MKFISSLLDALLGKPFSVRDEPDLSPIKDASKLLRAVDPYIEGMREEVEVCGSSGWISIESEGLIESRLVKYGPSAAMMTGTALECRTRRGTRFDRLCVSWFDLIHHYGRSLVTDDGPNPADLKGSTATLLGVFPQVETHEVISYRETQVGQLVSKPTGFIKWLFVYDCSIT
tara:strand:- start:72630 stop:73148 length:519 start_codon:yes stop_codon:yes gene_type:complete